MNEFEKLRENITKLLSDFETGETNNSEMDDLVQTFSEEIFMQNPNKLSLRYNKIDTESPEPKYEYPSDSGFDLRSTISVDIAPFGRELIPTGLRFDIPDGYEIQVRPKSGLAFKNGLTVLNTPGTVDSGYNAEVKVIVFNTNNYAISIDRGMKIAQAVICPVVNGKWVDLIKVENIEDKDRNNNGFGSTGIK